MPRVVASPSARHLEVLTRGAPAYRKRKRLLGTLVTLQKTGGPPMEEAQDFRLITQSHASAWCLVLGHSSPHPTTTTTITSTT